MTFLEALIQGIVQGLTEFLPVSSSGHLEIVKAMQGQNMTGETSILMTVVLHFATALSTIVVFRKEIMEIFRGLFQFKVNEQFLFSVKIVLSMIPAALIGIMFEEQIDQLFNEQVLLVGCMLFITGLLLFLADKAKNTDQHVGFGHSIIIGIAQAIAILPGISRSGATIGTSVLLGIDRERAARFSFLMVVPLILGKVAKDILSDEFSTTGVSMGALSVGFIAAFITGVLACTWMIGLVKRSKLTWFAYYCFIVGAGAVTWSFFMA